MRENACRTHPSHVPVILERGGTDAPAIDKERLLVPPDLTGSQLQYVVRRRLKMGREQALFLLCCNRLVTSSDSARELYAKHQHVDDGLLYITYTLENAFGAP